MSKWPRNASFYQKYGKRSFDFIISLLGLILFSPVFLLISFLIFIDSGWPVFFCQKRVGRNGKVFTIFKFRTMVKNAEKLKKKYLHLNEADGPVFKIKNDPRFTPLGKKLTRSGLDELPQLINVFLGQMSLVGPRPLPVDEEKRIKDLITNDKWPLAKYSGILKPRRSVQPGITSSWVVSGAHNLKFKQWMKLDNDYIRNISFLKDLKIIIKTLAIVCKSKSKSWS